ncbi:MAG: ATP-dependent DNA helicase DinG [Gammaproteobacteria bacterium]|nr:ATP-dependent DNA helicase DinG [Gammaproteobacteria bacterium]
MLTDKLKTTIQDAYTRILESKEIKPRYGQRLMIADIARTLGNIDQQNPDQPNICTLEAGTGTGKTIAYIVAALPIAREHKKKLIISTATIALQEQILLKDLPEIQRHSGLNFSFTLAKGRKRYVCLHKLENFIAHKNQADLPLDIPSSEVLLNNKDDILLYDDLYQAWKKRDWDGEIDSWNDFIAQSSWLPLTSDQHQCSGKRCSFYNECPYFKARESVFKVDCIIANHDLVLSDLNMGGGFILPSPDECIYIFDEGHHLPIKAINHFSYSFHINTTLKWLEQVNSTLNNFASLAKPPAQIQRIVTQFPEQAKDISTEINHLELIVKQFKFPENRFSSSAGNTSGSSGEQILRFEFGQIPEILKAQCLQLLKQFEKLSGQLLQINTVLKDTLDGEITGLKTEIAEQWTPALAPMESRASAAMNLFEFFTKKDKQGQPPNARWLKKNDSANNSYRSGSHSKQNELQGIELSCSPILAANTLEQILWSQCYGAVVTSATIAALGNFDRYVLNSGVPGFFNILPSPFNYQDNVEFMVPEMRSEATQYQSHTDEVVEILKKIIDPKKGTLVLFASKKQMSDVEYELLRSDDIWKKLLLTQGQRNKQVIINDHKKQIDKGNGSVILGLNSFAEGIDLPGEYCEHVIIAKLPFSVPNNPVDASLTEWIESQGRNAFMEIAVPDAAIKLVQACGRLIRKETDKGKITLLDKRVITKFYGKKILNALPPYRINLNVPID